MAEPTTAPAPVANPDPTPVADPSPAPATAPATAPEGSWLDTMSDDLKGSETLARFKGKNADEVMPEMAKSYLELRTKVGADTVKIPARTDDDAVWGEFYKAAGRPDEATGYTIPTEGLPEGFKLTDEGMAQFQGLAHASGMSDVQAANLYRGYAQVMADGQAKTDAAIEAQNTANLESIKQEFGQNMPERTALSKRLISQFDTDGEFSAYLAETGMGNDPRAYRWFSKASKMMANDKILGDPAREVGSSKTEAIAKIEAYERETEFMKAYHDPTHVDYRKNDMIMKKLYSTAYPDNPAAAS